MSEHDAPASGRDELAEFERQVSSSRRVVGYVLAAFGIVGCSAAAFLRVQASLGRARIRMSGGLLVVLSLSLIAAATDCGVAHYGAHAVHKVYPSLVELRFDTDRAFLLFGIVLLAALR